MRILITGGLGFLASHFVEHILKATDWEIILVDKCSGSCIRLEEIGCLNDDRVKLIAEYLEKPINPAVLKEIGDVDYIVHLGGRTLLDESLVLPYSFIETNIMGTCQMLQIARLQKESLKKFIYFSTDEVYGKPVGRVAFTEESHYRPSTPYAASKIGAAEMCLAWWNTFEVPVVITTCMSLIGERQSPSKYLPQLVRAAITGSKMKIYADPATWTPSYGDYLHARDAVSAVMFLLTHGKVGEKYNIARVWPHSSLDVLIEVERALKKPIDYDLVDPEKVRPGFYVRHGLNGSKLFAAGWPPPRALDFSVNDTVLWMLRPENRHWLGINDS